MKVAGEKKALPPWWGDVFGLWKSGGTTLSLSRDRTASWERKGRHSSRSLSGRLHFKEPDSIVISFLFFRKKMRVTRPPWIEEGEWRIEVDGRRLSRRADPSEALPPKEELERLTLGCFRAFNEALVVNDFRPFHAGVAELWKAQMGPEELAKAFSSFTERRITLSDFLQAPVAFNREPVIEAPSGFLRLDGYFASSPLLRFTIAFTYEYPDWKLVSINMNLG